MTDTHNIRRRPDGSIDFDYYDRIARRLRAHDQLAALAWLGRPFVWLMWAFGSDRRASARNAKTKGNASDIGRQETLRQV